jgi:ABC-type amino acid transport substrate-binding protein
VNIAGELFMRQIFITIAISLLIALGVSYFNPWNMPQAHDFNENSKETTYERVMRTGELRCGYFSWAPSFIKDANTGKMSGVFHDYVEALGHVLKLKIIWAEEVSLGEFPAALKSGRIDAMCASTFVTSERARAVDFITPLYFVPLHAYARLDDNRFDNFTADKFNNPAYKVIILEGGVTSIIQHYFLPDTKVYELPQFTSPAELFVGLSMGKADFLLYERYTFEDYNKHNPGKLKRVSDMPIKIFPLAIAIDKNQDALREMLDTATMDLHLAGTTERIIQRYEVYPDTLIRIKMPYQQ